MAPKNNEQVGISSTLGGKSAAQTTKCHITRPRQETTPPPPLHNNNNNNNDIENYSKDTNKVPPLIARLSIVGYPENTHSNQQDEFRFRDGNN